MHSCSGLTARAGATDLPIAGLLADLNQRGLLDDTLVVWGGEFGRTPDSPKRGGRDHARFTYRYAGRDFRLTDVYGRVVNEIMA